MKNMKKSTFALLAIGLSSSVTYANGLSHSEQQQNFIELLKQKNVQELDQVPGVLSPSFLSNFIIKHGMNLDGPRGHKHEADAPGYGIHAVADKPRIYIFQPESGFVISYNGDRTQQGGEALDLMTYDEKEKSFEFHKIDFPVHNGQYALNNQTCLSCHGGAGKNESARPIFSMYPDWPRFFGSDNDELNLAVRYPTDNDIPRNTDALTRRRIQIQRIEREKFIQFRNTIAPNHPRYSPLFSEAAFNTHRYGSRLSQYPEYPYRSDVEAIGQRLNPSDVSRAFARRAGLRFNLLYSRLLVKQVVENILSQEEQFSKFGKFFVYNTMRCGPETGDDAVIQRWKDRIATELRKVESEKSIEYRVWTEAGAALGTPLEERGNFRFEGLQLIGRKKALLHYGQNLALFGLKINDVDMRFTYYHPDYLPENAYRQLQPLDVMQVGYLGDSYFNSYNDGSTTMDEHLTAELLKELAKENATLRRYLEGRRALAIRGLLDKYGGATFEQRMRLDRPFFTKMDSISKWFSLPYP